MQTHQVGMTGMNLVERRPDMVVVVAGGAAAVGDAGSLRDQGLGFFTQALVHEVPAVDHSGGHRVVTDARPGARGPGLAGVEAELFGGAFAEKLHRVAALDHRDPFGARESKFDRAYFAAILFARALQPRLTFGVELGLY